MAIMIQNNELPDDWKDTVNAYDVSTLLPQTQCIVSLFKNRISTDLLGDKRFSSFIQDIICNDSKTLRESDSIWKELPLALVEDVVSEFGQITDIYEFTKKQDSMYVEFKAYSKIKDLGFEWNAFTRSEGSCDLSMIKNDKSYDIEVKFKESEDNFISFIHMFINGMSLLKEYSFIRGKIITVQLKTQNLTNAARQNIITEVKNYLTSEQVNYDGEKVSIYEVYIPPKPKLLLRDSDGKVNYNPLSNVIINETKSKEDVSNLAEKIFFNSGGHIDKMKNKAKKNPNFIGFLSWNHPFYNEIDVSEVKRYFKDKKLEFDLYIDIHGVGTTNSFLTIKATPQSHS